MGGQLCWKDHLVFSCNAVILMYVCTEVRSRQHQKVNLRSLMRMQWPIFVKLGMWVLGGTSTTHMVCHHLMHISNTSLAYLFWLVNNKKSNIQSSVWATLMKLGMWVVMGTSTTHVVCRNWMRIFNASFAYLFWLANNRKVKYPGGGHSLSEVTGMCLLQVKSRGLSGKMCTLQNMGSFSKQPE